MGVTIQNSLKPTMQCAKAASKANQGLGQLSRAVTYMDKMTFLCLYSVHVRPHLEYTETSWNLWTHVDRDCLEKVQCNAVGIPHWGWW